MANNNKKLVDSQIIAVQTLPPETRLAFEGALLMKKAGLGGSAPTKLRLFKEGRKMLESAIKQEPENGEYRFLRLMIQEHAPGFLGYNKDMEKDREWIQKTYKLLPEDVQQAIADYSKKSNHLKPGVS